MRGDEVEEQVSKRKTLFRSHPSILHFQLWSYISPFSCLQSPPAAGKDIILEDASSIEEMHAGVATETAPTRPSKVGSGIPMASTDVPQEAQCGAASIETVDAAVTSGKGGPPENGAQQGDVPLEANGAAPVAVGTLSSGKHYQEVKDDLISRIEASPETIPLDAWLEFPDHIGDGVRTRLTTLATIHLTEAGASRCPDQVRQLTANSNRVLLAGAPNCELYQERVIRTVAKQVGARMLVADATALHLVDLPPPSNPSPEEGGVGDGDGAYMAGGSGYDTSDEDAELPPLVDEMMGPPKQRPKVNPKRRGNVPPSHRSLSIYLREKADEIAAKEAPPTGGADAQGAEKAAHGEKAGGEKLESAKDKKLEEGKEDQGEEAVAGTSKTPATDAAKEIETSVAGGDTDAKAVAATNDAEKQDKKLDEAIERVEKEAPVLTKKILEESTELYKTTVNDNETFPAGYSARSAEIKRFVVKAEKVGAEAQKALAEAFEALRKIEGRGGSGTLNGPENALRGLGRSASGGRANSLATGLDEAFIGGGGGGGAGGPSSDPHHFRLPHGVTAWKKGDRVSYLGVGGVSASEERERAHHPAFQIGLSEMREAGLSRLSLPGLMARREAALNRRKASAIAAAGGSGPSNNAGLVNANSGGEDGGAQPPQGAFGRVHSVNGDRIEVIMDLNFPGGKNFPSQPEKCGFICSHIELGPVDEREDAMGASFQALFDVIKSESGATPLVVFLPGMDRMLRSNNTELFRQLKYLLSHLPPRCLFVGGYCSRALAKEKSSSAQNGLSMLFGGGSRGGGDSLSVGPSDDFPPWYERLGRGASRTRSSVKGRAFASMLPNHVELHPPHADSAAKAWKKMLDADVACMRERSNRAALKKALATCEVVCSDLEAVKITELALSKKEVEQVVGAAVASALMESSATKPAEAASETDAVEVASQLATAIPAADDENMKDAIVEAEASVVPMTIESAIDQPQKAAAAALPAVPIKNLLIVSAEHLTIAAASVQSLRAEAAPVPEKSVLKDVSADQYERQLLSEVIPPEEIPVGFDDIGALDAIKTTLHEVVILPLQRPELFTRGALTRPTKGLLLFGPPGTGKTMLAKAVASESGAHFININMSAITSKWLGEGERLVRAVFSLAHKLAPSVIFIDEIDSFLARRGGHSHEHEALRKMKTEFLAGWDGIRTKSTDRVLVLAATNRPMDLDDAAVRRMPRRIFVPLPDAANREKILSVILNDEEVDSKLDFAELGRETDGYSGSDLKNLCIAAAYCPLRELLQAEKERKGEGELPPVRPISMNDFKSAMKQVTPSTHADTATMSELQRWNEQFGEGGSRRNEPLVYYT